MEEGNNFSESKMFYNSNSNNMRRKKKCKNIISNTILKKLSIQKIKEKIKKEL